MYKIIIFYPRQHQPTFNTKQEALDFLKARALTRRTACYTEVWHMDNETDGEMVALYDYGCTEPQKLTNPVK